MSTYSDEKVKRLMRQINEMLARGPIPRPKPEPDKHDGTAPKALQKPHQQPSRGNEKFTRLLREANEMLARGPILKPEPEPDKHDDAAPKKLQEPHKKPRRRGPEDRKDGRRNYDYWDYWEAYWSDDE